MDRNQIIGFSLIAALLIGYFVYVGSVEQPRPPQTAASDTLKNAQLNPPKDTVPDSVKQQQKLAQLADFATAAQGQEKEIVLENTDIKVTLSSKGGTVKKVQLKQYKTYWGEPLYLLDEKSSAIRLNLTDKKNQKINLSELYYKDSSSAKPGEPQKASFRMELASGQYVEHRYSLPASGFQLDYNLAVKGLEDKVVPSSVEFSWAANVPRTEYDDDKSREITTVNYYLNKNGEGEFNDLQALSEEVQNVKIAEPIRWVALKHKFFNTAIISKSNFSSGEVFDQVDRMDSSGIEKLSTTLQIPYAEASGDKASFQFYFGPNKYNICKEVTEGFGKNVYLGWPVVNQINRFVVIPVFNFLENYIGNYGIIIIILVILLKLVLFPLAYKSYMSMAKMKVLKPEIDAIGKKYPDDMQRKQAEQMKLYQTVGINPLSGCIPVLLQMPITIAFFSFFPSCIELRQQGFLWASDLSIYDHNINLGFTIPFYGSHVSIFTLLMTLSTLAYTYFNNQISTTQGPMKYISYIMPVIFLFILNKFPAGLSFYYLMTNVFSIGQQLIIRRYVDENAIRAKMEDYRKNYQSGNVKKNRFMQRLEDTMKAQEEAKKKKGKK